MDNVLITNVPMKTSQDNVRKRMQNENKVNLVKLR